jgi:hypothetical protein
MKKLTLAVAAAALLATAQAARATPSTTYWTPATTYTQPFLLPHLTYDSYVAEQGALQNDYGFTIGVLPGDKFQAEVGADVLLPGYVKNNFYLNGKVTLVEGAYAKWQPGVSVGVLNVGFKTDISNYDTVHLSVGKTTPIGVLTVGGYYGAGSKVLWTSSKGTVNRSGFMASYVSPDIVLDRVGVNKVNFIGDIATGDNYFGAYGGGLLVYFTPAIDLITGPVWFQDKQLYKNTYGTDFTWTVQVDIDFDLQKVKPAPKT